MEGEKKFDCTDCIAFCCSNVYAVTLTGVEVARLSLRLGVTPQEFRRRYTVDGHTLRQKEDPIFEKACIFLDPVARHCTVYTARPGVCRAWPRPEDAAPGAAGRCGFYDLYTHLRNELEPNVVPLFQLVRAVDSQHPATQPNPARAVAQLREQANRLAEELRWDEGIEIFRRIAAREITAGGFVTAFADAVAKADLENQVLIAPTCFLLLAKYPHLLEQHRAKPTVTSFPPSE